MLMSSVILIALIFVSIFFCGCATMQASPKVNELEVRMSELERKLEVRDGQLQELEENIQNLSEQISGHSLRREGPPLTPGSVSVKSQSKLEDRSIIRVEIRPDQLQMALKAAGYYTGPIDGKPGALTKKAVIEFQRAHDLNPDGIVGKKTWEELRAYLQ